jgi:archaemetzincin
MQGTSMKLLLAPIGEVPNELLSWLAKKLTETLEWDVDVGEIIDLPQSTYNPRRDQYRGESILNLLRYHATPKTDRILGLTDVDCYSSDLNFVFGQASIDGREAFIALPRLRQSFYGLSEDRSRFRDRVIKEAVHELGHTWGLRHCHDPRCVMYFSNSLQDTDRKKAKFCADCEVKLESITFE